MTTLEDLNKTQLVMLTLLVSFVSSVATGIITTSLLAEAPVSVTQTINRVVERTIETVAPVPSGAKEVTLKEEDRLLLASVNSAAQNVVRIQEDGEGTTTPSFLGVIVTKDGFVVTPYNEVRAGKTYSVILTDDTRLPLAIATSSAKDNLVIFKIKSDPKDTQELEE